MVIKSKPEIVTRALKHGWIFRSVYLGKWIFCNDCDTPHLTAQELRDLADELDARNEGKDEKRNV